MSNFTTYQIRLPADLLSEFRSLAKARDRSPAAEIREFMRGYVAEKRTMTGPKDRRPVLSAGLTLVEGREGKDDIPF